MTTLEIRNLTLRRGYNLIVSDASISFCSGEFVAILGANGAGKTSLIRGALGVEKLDGGVSSLDGEPVFKLSAIQRAQRIAYLPQIRSLAWPVTVRDVVSLGRYCHGFGKLLPKDHEVIGEALRKCSLEHLSNRKTDSLSGGEIARVHCARMLATDAQLMIADEPTLSLDPYHQFQIMNIFSEFVSNGGGVLVVLHDIQMAAKYASRLVWMKNGSIVGDGDISETLNENMIKNVYGVTSKVSDQEVNLLGSND